MTCCMKTRKISVAFLITSFWPDEDAQAMVEYALLASILVLASYAAIRLFVEVWKTKFNSVKNTRTGMSGIIP